MDEKKQTIIIGAVIAGIVIGTILFVWLITSGPTPSPGG